MLLRIGQDEVRVQSCRSGALAGQRQHRRGDVQAGAVCRRARSGRGQQAGPGTAADVEQLRDGIRKFGHQQVGHRLEQAVENGLLCDPDLAAWAIPERILINGGCTGHGLVLPGSCP